MTSPPADDSTPDSQTNPGLKVTADAESPDESGFSIQPIDASLPSVIDTAGRYSPIEKLGAGGFGLVIKAFDQELRRPVAVKLLHSASERGKVALLKEARTLASLDHPGIVPVYDVGRTAKGALFVVSKLITGQDLAVLLKNYRPSIHEAVKWTALIADALDYAHQHRIVHRDIKPSNVLLTVDRVPVLSDFGLALEEANYGAGSAFVGTPAYMSPEQARYEGHRVDGRSDIYSLGTVLFEMLTGSRPFAASGREELLELIRTVEPRPLRQLNGALPRELERIVLRALQKRASDRYPVARDFAEDLRYWLERADDPQTGSVTITDSHGPSPLEKSSSRSKAEPSTAPPSETTSSQPVQPMVVPRGLRAFDEADADFFLSLLPGARDRDGLPDSVRFWKSHIEQLDAGETFRVAVLLSPSGSGKSSLVRAGILPHLVPNIRHFIFDASPQELESRILKRLQREYPQLQDAVDLVEALNELRRQLNEQPGQKVLIVIDQFEQWLNAHSQEANPKLSQALRQCDGSSLQALLLVRDDFTLAISEFMDMLEEPLLQTKNFATVEPFSVEHALRVLENFGRAYGIWTKEPSKENRKFMELAVKELTQSGGRIAPVQLAALSEIIKELPWTEATLRSLGGIKGIGVAFLEQRLAGDRSHPELRQHLPMVRRILQALLPAEDENIRGNAKSRSELLNAVGEQFSRDRFDRVLMLLDADARLLTAVGSSGSVSESSSHTTSGERETSYQLAHDYLVPSIRTWLTAGERATRRGRARLHLRQLAESWTIRPDRQRLPTFVEWLTLAALTRRGDYSTSETRMMRAAKRHHLSRAALWCCVVLAMMGSWAWINRKRHVEAGFSRLLAADTSEVPSILAELSESGASIDQYKTLMTSLEPKSDAGEDSFGSRRRLHLHLAMTDADADSAQYVIDHLDEVLPEQLDAVAELFDRTKQERIPQLWKALDDPDASSSDPRRLAVAGLLAKFDGDSPEWKTKLAWLASQLTYIKSSQLASWLRHFAPLNSRLADACLQLVRGKTREAVRLTELQRELLYESIAYLSRDNSELLIQSLELANAYEARPIHLALSQRKDRAEEQLNARITQLLDAETTRELSPEAKNATNALAKKYSGMFDATSGYLTNIPEPQLESVLTQLSALNYRPVTLRPFASKDGLHIALVLAQSVNNVRWELDVPAKEVASRVDSIEKSSGRIIDFCAYEPKWPQEQELRNFADLRYALLWQETTSSRQASLCTLQVPEERMAEIEKKTRAAGMYLARRDERCDAANRIFIDSLWFSNEKEPFPSFSRARAIYSFGELYPDYVVNDLRMHRNLFSESDRFSIAQAFAEERKRITGNAGSRQSISLTKMIRYLVSVGEFDKAREYLAKASPSKSAADLIRCLIVFANQKDLDGIQALKQQPIAADIPGYQRLSALYEMMAADNHEGLAKELDVFMNDTEIPHDSVYLQTLAYAIRALKQSGSDLSSRFTKAFMSTLDDLLATKQISQPEIFLNSEVLDDWFKNATFRATLAKHGCDGRFHSVWLETTDIESEMILDHRSTAHERRARELYAAGYYPVCVESLQRDDGEPLICSSLWHRKLTPVDDRVHRAGNAARLALERAKLGNTRSFFSGLAGIYGADYQSQLTRYAPDWISVDLLLEWLEEQQSVEVYRSLCFILGQIPREALGDVQRERLKTRLEFLDETAQEAGLHSAVLWCASQLNLPSITASSTNRQKTNQRRNWYSNALGQTMITLDSNEPFLMGSPIYEAGRNVKEQLHWRLIGRRYSLSAHEVTVGAFREFLEDPKVKEYFKKDGITFEFSARYAPEPECPQTSVRWVTAICFCQWLSEREKIPESQWCYPDIWNKESEEWAFPANLLERKGYRLPTEAEWEFACRAGSSESRYYGNDVELAQDYTWYVKDAEERTHPIGSKIPNAFGFFDMLGNCQELCFNVYDSYRVPLDSYVCVDRLDETELRMSAGDGQTKAEENPSKSKLRIMRGGCFENMPRQMRSADRASADPWAYHFTQGFRVARTEN